MLYRVYEFNAEGETCYNIDTSNHKIKLSEIHRLFQILYKGQPLRYNKPFFKNVTEHGTKLNFESPWSMNMKAILVNSGISTIKRIERTFRTPAYNIKKIDIDPVLETTYDSPITTFDKQEKMASTYNVNVDNISYHNTKLNLGMDQCEIDYYTDLYRNVIKRNPTNVELFDLSQSNSEHSRHWFFNGGLKFEENGHTLEETLFKMVKSTQTVDSNSIIAFDIRNKKILWHFQETCHDIWNFDIAAPPILTTINKKNKRIDVVVALTKLGNTIILDRLSGEPIFDYEMRLAPVSKFPGEKTCEYQPFFKIPEPFSRNIFKKEDITIRTKADRDHVISQVNKSNFGFFPTHEINKYTITYNINGGAQWTGGSVDPYKNILYVSANQIPYKIMVMGSFNIKDNFKYETNLMKTEILNGLDGYPGVKPPWGTLTSINLNNGKIIWQIPLGNHKNLKVYENNTGTLNFGGPTATAGGLIFVGGTLDKLFRVFDSETGKELWSYELPYIGSAPPSIYEANKEQYIIIPATGGYSLEQNYPDLVEQGDAFIAFKINN